MAPRLFALLSVALVALALAPAGQAAVPAPGNLHPFLLTSGEPVAAGRTYARTPSFAWNKVTGARSYEFELATGPRFSDNAIVWEKTGLTAPLTTIPVTLPWMTGSPYSFYARVRAKMPTGAVSAWTPAYGFRLRSPAAPTSLSSGPNPNPGMIRWTPVDGATAYEVTFLFDLGTGLSKKIKTATTAADLREYYTLHNDYFSVGNAVWRVRAVREVAGKTSNLLPAVSYGPWSSYAVTSDPPISNAPDHPDRRDLAQPDLRHHERDPRPRPESARARARLLVGRRHERRRPRRLPAVRDRSRSPARSTTCTSSRTRTASTASTSPTWSAARPTCRGSPTPSSSRPTRTSSTRSTTRPSRST